MPSTRTLSILNSFREAILVVCIIYFFALGFALQFGRPTHRADQPVFFLIMFGLFLAAIGMEVVLEWHARRRAIFWGVCFMLAYGLIGLYLLPKVFGPSFLVYGLIEPIVIIFFGGFAYAYANLFTRTIFFSARVTPKEFHGALKELPGWNLGTYFEKTFHFKTFADGLNFVNRLRTTFKSEQAAPGIIIKFGEVTIKFKPHPLQGISHTQLEMAKEVERRV